MHAQPHCVHYSSSPFDCVTLPDKQREVGGVGLAFQLFASLYSVDSTVSLTQRRHATAKDWGAAVSRQFAQHEGAVELNT